MKKIIAVRGATTLDADTREEIVDKTKELISELVIRNNIDGSKCRCVSVIISSTKDVRSFYPARAIRESRLIDAPLFSCLEPDIVGAMPLCIRVMLTIAQEKAREPKHVYLHGAAELRPDLAD